MKNILFYKYIPIENVEKFREEHEKLCKSLHLLGKVLVSEEGINGCVSGEESNIEKYKGALRKNSRFSDIIFKEGIAKEHTFRKIFVKIRKEIIISNFDADASQAAPYVEPEKLKEWLDKKENILLLDARNDYETKIGMFENAIDPNLKTFQEFIEVPKKFSHLKNKKIVTYCTGGIRCEKASALLRKYGFKNVYQLHGGILEYGKRCGNAHWRGECFVFDRREHVPLDPNMQSGEISEEIRRKYERKQEPRTYAGKILNYYKKKKIAHMMVESPIKKGDVLIIEGKTTPAIRFNLMGIKQDEHVLDSGKPGEDVTFPLSSLVRANDKVYKMV